MENANYESATEDCRLNFARCDAKPGVTSEFAVVKRRQALTAYFDRSCGGRAWPEIAKPNRARARKHATKNT
jgi:hypothetical protein